MKKTVICLLTALCLFAFSACGGGASRPSAVPSASPSVQPAASPSVQPSAAPTASPSVRPSAVPSASLPIQPSAVPTASPSARPSGRDAIPFEGEQWYAAAYLGYQEKGDLDHYVQRYLDGVQPPVYTVSDGDYYLVIPRYDGMALTLSAIDLETSQTRLLFEDPDCGPFLLQCNASDVFADACVRLSLGGEAVEFSPFISLKDGSLELGEYGLDITRPGVLPSGE